jgi:hypothetical protein
LLALEVRSFIMGEPCARGVIFVAARSAALELWGKDGLDAIAARLSDEARRATLDSVVVASDWLPEHYMLEWYEAAWDGPAQRSPAELRYWVDKRIDRGFGRVRKLLLTAVTPARFLTRGPELWRHDHSTGSWRGSLSEGRGVVTLWDHPYATTEVARLGIAEVFRYILGLARGSRHVAEEHSVDSAGVLTVRLTWSRAGRVDTS